MQGPNLTVRDLLAACSVPDMLARFPKVPCEGPFDVAAYQAFYDRLMRKRPVKTGVVVLGVWWRPGDDDGYVQPRCFKVDQLVAKFNFNNHYLKVKNPSRMSVKALEALPRDWHLPGECAMEIVKAERTMGYEVFAPNADKIGRLDLAAWIFFELSSWGLTARGQKATVRELRRDIRQSEKELAEGRSYTMDEVREHLGIPKPTKREEARRHRQALIDGSTFARDLFGAMADYVRAEKGDSNADSIPARKVGAMKFQKQQGTPPNHLRPVAVTFW